MAFKTVNNDTFSVSDTLKSSFVEAHEILNKYKNELFLMMILKSNRKTPQYFKYYQLFLSHNDWKYHDV